MEFEANRINLIDNLKCFSCANTSFPPIVQCSNNHTFCPNCSKRLSKCSQCDQSISIATTRNTELEEIYVRLELECKYKTKGCTVRAKGLDLRDHEKCCPHRRELCPFPECSWSGGIDQILDHCLQSHADRKYVRVIEKSHCRSCSIHGSSDELFCLTVTFCCLTGLSKWKLFHVGREEPARSFHYELVFGSSDSGKPKRFVGRSVAVTEDVEETRDSYVLTEYDMTVNGVTSDCQSDFQVNLYEQLTDNNSA